MIGIFSKVRSQVKIKHGKVHIDNPMFRLHYRFSFLLLCLCCLLSTSRQYFGEHIQCIQDSAGVPPKVLNNYCFIMSTFSVPKSYTGKIGEDIPYMGIGNPGKQQSHGRYGHNVFRASAQNASDEGSDVIYHNYYQWVPFCLFLQAIMFYTPYFIWKRNDNNKVRTVIQGLNIYELEGQKREKQEDVLAMYFLERLHIHVRWALSYFVCELLCLVNVIGQMFFTNYFLGGTFLTYGVQVFEFLDQDAEVRADPMAVVFPRVTKCTFHKFGSSGTIQRHDAMCVLALNVINEKIYVFLWFWFILLGVLTAFHLIYRIATLSSYTVRKNVIKAKTGLGSREYLNMVVPRCDIADWLLLSFLSKNMEVLAFNEFLERLAKKMVYGTKQESFSDESDVKMPLTQ
ncbi:innexin inx2-like [Artemia franciscana]|uniref:Innexin n=1 Tax=Artemia franciscana TaxID=6661 RepID=A0AA88HTG1_ARTSF|nr:hypothetical protein QYM36_009364 [Artemia franciscana]